MSDLSAFAAPPGASFLRQADRRPLPSALRAPRRPFPKATASLRRELLRARFPDLYGHGGMPSYVTSVRHPSLNLFTLTWRPITRPKAGLVISPGLQWHSGWFSKIGRALAAAGVQVVALDGVGIGRSDNLRNTRGLITDTADHVSELSACVDRLSAELPRGAPVFMLGESSGGLSAALMAFDDVNGRIAGYVLCAPALLVKKELLPPRPVMELVRAVGRVWPELPVPGDEIGGETWDLAFGERKYAQLSKRDPYVGYGDPLRMGTARAFMGGMQRIDEALGKGEMSMRNVLVLHNRADQRTEFENSRRFVELVECDGRKELVEPGGTGHQLFQDTVQVTNHVVGRVVDFVVETAQREKARTK